MSCANIKVLVEQKTKKDSLTRLNLMLFAWLYTMYSIMVMLITSGPKENSSGPPSKWI
jgi:hypothetical protein